MIRANRFRRWIAIALAPLVVPMTPSGRAADLAPAQKLDATLAAIARDASGRAAAQSAPTNSDPGRPERSVETILRFDGNLDAVRAQGAVVRSVMGDIATVDIPVSRLAAVAALPGVVSIQAAHPQPRRVEPSSPACP
jgi:hypothetical protein